MHKSYYLHKEPKKVKKNWEVILYFVITLKWDYVNGTFFISMPGYDKDRLKKYVHPSPTRQ